MSMPPTPRWLKWHVTRSTDHHYHLQVVLRDTSDGFVVGEGVANISGMVSEPAIVAAVENSAQAIWASVNREKMINDVLTKHWPES